MQCKISTDTLFADTLPAGILLIGDSTDRQLVEAVCPQDPLYFAEPVDEAPRFRALKCELPGLQIAVYPIWGIFEKGAHPSLLRFRLPLGKKAQQSKDAQSCDHPFDRAAPH